MNRPKKSVTLFQATQDSPTLLHLSKLALDSTARLKSLAPLLPIALRTGIKPGPIDGLTWCLILENSAVAAKVKQLVPLLIQHLNTKGWEVTSIRLKIQTQRQAE